MFDKEPMSFEDYLKEGKRSWDKARQAIQARPDRATLGLTDEEIDERLIEIQRKNYNDYVENFSYFEEIEPGKRWRLVKRNASS